MRCLQQRCSSQLDASKDERNVILSSDRLSEEGPLEGPANIWECVLQMSTYYWIIDKNALILTYGLFHESWPTDTLSL